MRKIICLALLFTIIAGRASAQGIDYFIMSLPEKYIGQISLSQRQMLINNIKSNKKDSIVSNRFGGTSKLITYDEKNEYIHIQTSSQGALTAKKIMLKDGSPLFVLNFVVCGSACNGEISFYKGDKLSYFGMENFIPKIKVIDFFDKDSLAANEIKEDEVETIFDALFFVYNINEDNDNLTLQLDNEKYIGKEAFLRWKKMMKGDHIDLKWNGRTYDMGEAYFPGK